MAAGAHDRIALRRRDEAWLEERWADPDTRVLVVSGTRVQPRGRPDPWVSPQDAPEGLRVLLGEHDGRAWFAVITGPEVAKAAKDEWFPLRGLLPHLADQDAGRARRWCSTRSGLAEWLWVTRFCPRCGEPLTPRAAGHELACANCGTSQFPRTDPAVIMVVTSGEPGQRGRALPARPPGDLAGGPLLDPGGLLRAGGDPRGRRTSRGAGGDRRRGRGRRVLRQPALAAAGEPDARLRRPRGVGGHQRRQRRDRRRPVVHPRRDEGRRGGGRRWCSPAASRSAAHWSSTGTAARCPASGERGTHCAHGGCSRSPSAVVAVNPAAIAM